LQFLLRPTASFAAKSYWLTWSERSKLWEKKRDEKNEDENMKMMTASLWSEVSTDQARESETVRVEFDGGSTCNIPRLGYGQGYGSYRIGDGKVQRLQFQECMSANCAEILTLVAAVEFAKKSGAKKFLIVGDSQIALKWANVACGNRKATKTRNTSEGFQRAIVLLYQVARGLRIETKWQPREVSFVTFGH
jgi:ribonuclease HI